ncbi:phage holin family protein [Ligilactobacillus sp.]|uniref:phage holin family protein n=1 Tax=Ligilactobacillus sp. TaxID=2767921 RepID=UPI002FE1BE31
MSIDQFSKFAGNGLDQTNILITFALLDTILGISLHLLNKQPLISNKFLSGLTRNFVPAFLPALLQFLENAQPSTPPSYGYAEFFIFVCAGYFLLQSILSNLNGLGTPLPTWLTKWLTNELKEKGLK